jgi:hypothetical protein
MGKLTKKAQLRVTWWTPPSWPYTKPGTTREQTYPIDDVNLGTRLEGSPNEQIAEIMIEEVKNENQDNGE